MKNSKYVLLKLTPQIDEELNQETIQQLFEQLINENQDEIKIKLLDILDKFPIHDEKSLM